MNTKTPGTKVQGQAAPGDKVTYFDMANQDGLVWEITSTPEDNTNPVFGWSKGYGLMGPEGQVNFSDLRQNGWSFA
jgi:hypothetical protein